MSGVDRQHTVEVERPGQSEPEPLRIYLLGDFRLSIGPRVIEEEQWRLQRAATLIKLLALAPSHRLYRDVVIDLLWLELDTRAGSNNLHHVLHVARRVLTGDETTTAKPVALHGDTIAFQAPSAVWTDVEAFEAAASAAREAGDPQAYRAALDLYAGDLLPSDIDEDWTVHRRLTLANLFIALLLELAQLQEQRGEHNAAIEMLCRALERDPALEPVHAGLMRLYAATGQRRKALSQYEQLTRALREELDAEPDIATTRLYEGIRAADTSVGAAEPPSTAETASNTPGHNLPAALSSFIGREATIADVQAVLSAHRCATLTGAGGTGKTRLACEVARQMLSAFPDGVWFIELASLSDGALVGRAVAGAVAVQEQPDQLLSETLMAALQQRRMLLVLDNCEHVIDDCAYLSEAVLSSCPGIRILATSREALCIPGEVTYTVPPLSLPDPGEPASPGELETIDAIRLFLERARARQRDFILTPQTAGAVAQICRQTDGLPLAIELAAARVGQLSVDQIAARLTNALTLLTGGSRTAGPRQQTLRGALDWSYDLLSQPERALLRRMAVFAGGWSLEAAEHVGAGTDAEGGEVLDLLSRLVDKSFVVAHVAAAGSMRYRLLEPIRQYARALLEESGETVEVCRRHIAYFAQFAEEGEQGLKGGEQEVWLERLETEHDNLRAALLHACRPEELATGLRLAGALWRFWFTHGHLSEGRDWFERLLALTSQASDDEDLRQLQAKALNGAGGLAYYQCDYDRASEWYGQSLALSRSLGDTRGIASCTGNLGLVMRERGDLARAATLHEESVALYRSLGDMSGAAHNLNNLGIVVQDGGDYARATTLHEESLALKRELGDHWGMGLSLANLGLLARHVGDLDRAEALYKEALELLATVGDKVAAAACLEELAGIAGALADFTRAATLYGAAAALREAVGAPLSPHDRADYDRDLAVVRGAAPDDLFSSSWATGATMSIETAVAYASTRGAPAESGTAVESTTALPPASLLTRREREIAQELALGLTNRQIGEKLCIAERTVDTHVRSILSKLGLASRTQVAMRLLAEPQVSGTDR